MEKLQAALAKARSKRENEASQNNPSRLASSSAQGERESTLWSKLHEIELSDKILFDHNVVSQQASDTATPFDILRTKILLQMKQNAWKSLAVTSPMPKSGKTTTACNLALGIGRQSGLRTILFDLDLNKPSVQDFLGHKPEADIADMLNGQISFAEQAVRIGMNVAVSMSNRTEPDPTRIMLSAKTQDTLKEIETTFQPDIIIYDLPSILVGDNTRAFLKNVDCALIVARANSTRFGHFDACEREVAEYTNVLGVALNAFRTKNLERTIE